MSPRVLFFDIETAPNLSYVWGHYDQNVIRHEREWYIMCYSAKWQGEREIIVDALDDYPDYYKDHENDIRVVQNLWDLLDSADIVIAHNGDKFDIRKANARFVAHGLGPTSPFKTVDTLKVARRNFMFNSNKLGDLGVHLGLGGKEATGGFETWAGCMRGDLKAWAKMKKYAKQDTRLLEKVYLALRPWMKSHPNLNVFGGGGSGCPTCGSSKLQRRGTRTTNTMTYQQYQCQKCSSYSRARMAEKIDRPEIVS